MLPFSNRNEDTKLFEGHRSSSKEFDQNQTEACDEEKSHSP
jgi:hypothetical protein